MQPEDILHSRALFALQSTPGADGIEAAMMVYPVGHAMRERIKLTLNHVDAGISPPALAHEIVGYQIEISLSKNMDVINLHADRRRDSRLKGLAKKDPAGVLCSV